MSNVTVEINGRETVSQAALQASGSVKKMSDDSKKFLSDITVTAGDVVNAVRGIASTVTEFVTLYAEQQKAVTNLNTAIEMSDKVSKDSIKGLTDFATELQALTGIGNETTIALEAMLIASGRNEQQTRQLIKAAADYSAATGKDFKASVEELNKSFSGSEGRLGMIIPELKELTDEELKSGAALDIVTSKYGGFSEKLADTASVALASFNASWGDMKEALGEAIMPAVQPILEALVNFLNDPVIPLIQGFAPIVKEVFENVEKFITDLKPAIEPILNWFGGVWSEVIGPNIRSVGTILKETLSVVSGIINGDWKRVWDGLKNAVTAVIDIIKRAFQPIIDAVETVIGGIQKAVGFLSGPSKNVPTNAQGQYVEPGTGKAYTYDANTGTYYDPAKKQWLKVPGFARGTAGAPAGVALVGEEGPELVIFRGGEQVIPNDQLPSMARALGIPGYAAGTSRGGGGVEVADVGMGGDMSGFMAMISELVGQFSGLIQSVASITAIINYGETIFSAMMDVLGPLINTVLQPIVGILRIVGTTLGAVLAPVITALSPVIELVTEAFVWLYNNAIRPVANAFIWVGNAIYNAIVSVVNWIKGIVGGKKLEYKSMDSGMLEKIDFQDVTAAGTTSYGGTTGASASYQRQRDITVNVAVNTSALVGDDGISQFALIIGRELKAAGVLGMA